MALSDSTDVPPNFITIIGRHPWLRSPSPVSGYEEGACWLPEQTLGSHEFCVQYRRTRRSANCVVATGDELHAKHGALAQSADESDHAILAPSIAARLRTIGLRHVDDGLRRCAWKLSLLGYAAETLKRATNFTN